MARCSPKRWDTNMNRHQKAADSWVAWKRPKRNALILSIGQRHLACDRIRLLACLTWPDQAQLYGSTINSLARLSRFANCCTRTIIPGS